MAGQDHRGFDDDAFGTPRSSGCQRRREWSCERRPDAPPDGASGLWGARQDQTYVMMCIHQHDPNRQRLRHLLPNEGEDLTVFYDIHKFSLVSQPENFVFWAVSPAVPNSLQPRPPPSAPLASERPTRAPLAPENPPRTRLAPEKPHRVPVAPEKTP